MTEILAMLLIALIGAGLILSGIYLLVGTAWTLIAAGMACIAFAAIIRRGAYRA
ncbi:hypothetical protein [Sphingopyxis flava]|uniref:Uncharacterized protein n=1 Tax=Sphingopyxis flava TaxID=1507287 RepID=A0A1T4ZX23_9SPHN|nr:hypothetical protein [Sphingopyxis flava]SKB27117.1 hypothetical protein SAMN06295937_1001273 [Sphingopyxis flava]